MHRTKGLFQKIWRMVAPNVACLCFRITCDIANATGCLRNLSNHQDKEPWHVADRDKVGFLCNPMAIKLLATRGMTTHVQKKQCNDPLLCVVSGSTHGIYILHKQFQRHKHPPPQQRLVDYRFPVCHTRQALVEVMMTCSSIYPSKNSRDAISKIKTLTGLPFLAQ